MRKKNPRVFQGTSRNFHGIYSSGNEHTPYLVGNPWNPFKELPYTTRFNKNRFWEKPKKATKGRKSTKELLNERRVSQGMPENILEFSGFFSEFSWVVFVTTWVHAVCISAAFKNREIRKKISWKALLQKTKRKKWSKKEKKKINSSNNKQHGKKLNEIREGKLKDFRNATRDVLLKKLLLMLKRESKK